VTESPVELSKLVFGTMGYGNISAAQRIRCIHCAIDHGLTSIDTAPLYGFGEVERIVGRAIRDRRSAVQLLGKCGLRWDCDYGEAMFAAEVGGQTRLIRKDSRPMALQRDVEDSLKRLRTETIDLMQVHEHDPLTPLEDTLDCLVKLQTQGKIRAIGVSNFSLSKLSSAQQQLDGNLFSTQNMFNILDEDSTTDIRRFACRNDLRFLGYSPFAQGALAGKLLNSITNVDDWRNTTVSFHPRNVARMNASLLRTAIPITEKYDITLPQLVLEATLARPGVTHVIVGARTPEQIHANAHAARSTVAPEALEEFSEAMRRCGWNRLAGESWPVRLRALARQFRGNFRLRSLRNLT
jgi:aryl-alcohol dehydrogenase-like predicted oxidoreductase